MVEEEWQIEWKSHGQKVCCYNQTNENLMAENKVGTNWVDWMITHQMSEHKIGKTKWAKANIELLLVLMSCWFIVGRPFQQLGIQVYSVDFFSPPLNKFFFALDWAREATVKSLSTTTSTPTSSLHFVCSIRFFFWLVSSPLFSYLPYIRVIEKVPRQSL